MKSETRKLVRRQSRNGSKAPAIASKNCNTWLYAEDLEEVLRMVSAKRSNESAVIRDIVHEWVRLKKKKVLAAEAASGPEQFRTLVEDAIVRQLGPLREKQAAIGDGIGELLALIAGLKENFPATKTSERVQQTNQAPEILGLLASLEKELTAARQDILSTRNEVGEGMGTQIHQLGRLLEGSQAQYTLLGQAFICNWTMLDLLVRYLVEASLRSQKIAPDLIESDVTEDRERLREFGLQIIQAMENELGVPTELRLRMVAPLLPAPK